VIAAGRFIGHAGEITFSAPCSGYADTRGSDWNSIRNEERDAFLRETFVVTVNTTRDGSRERNRSSIVSLRQRMQRWSDLNDCGDGKKRKNLQENTPLRPV